MRSARTRAGRRRRYCPPWWPANTRLLIRRVEPDPAQVSVGPRSRRRLTLHSDQRPADPRTGRGGPGRWGTDQRERYVIAGGTCVCDRRTAKDELTSTESGDRRV
jgi:hypothetical protein